jgi:hypothetical protein
MDETDKLDDIGIVKTIPMNIYLLWRSKEHDKFTIQALFSPKGKFDFKLMSRLSDGTRQDQHPGIYQLHLDLTKNADDELTVRYKKTTCLAKQYMLQLHNLDKWHLFDRDYEENIPRTIDNMSNSHHFLFDVDFQPSSSSSMNFQPSSSSSMFF